MITRVILMRHGQTAWNADGRWQGQAPVPLDAVGREQAYRAAQYLETETIDRVFTSDLIRAVDTAQIVATHLQIPMAEDPRLREIHIGTWQGLTRDEVKLWDAEQYAAIKANPIHGKRPLGESWADVGTRALLALQDYVVQHAGESLLVVTHGGVIRIVLQTLELPIDTNFTNENTALTELHYEGEKWALKALGKTTHLAN